MDPSTVNLIFSILIKQHDRLQARLSHVNGKSILDPRGQSDIEKLEANITSNFHFGLCRINYIMYTNCATQIVYVKRMSGIFKILLYRLIIARISPVTYKLPVYWKPGTVYSSESLTSTRVQRPLKRHQRPQEQRVPSLWWKHTL